MIPLLVSTDIGSDIDDALALLAMLNHPEVKISGIYTVNGKVTERCLIAKHMVDLAGRNIPIGCGLANPIGAIVKPFTYFEEYLVDDRYIDEEAMAMDPRNLYFKKLADVGVKEDGIAHMAEQLSNERHAILSLGPLSNIAALLQQFPDSIPNIDRIYVMGFRIGDGLEHNIRFDPVAAKKVLQSNVPITIIPGDICTNYRMKWTPATSFPSSVGQYVTSMLNGYMGAKIVEQSRAIGLTERLEKSQLSSDALSTLGVDEYQAISGFKHLLMVNFDEANAFLEREHFLQKLIRMAQILQDKKTGYDSGPFLAKCLQELLVREVSVADVYIPYCFLHSEKVETQKMGLSCDSQGKTTVFASGDYDVVTNLDYVHFEEFLQQYLR